MHPDQLSVPLVAVRSLVDDQFPAWRHLPVTAVRTGGTVNAIFRIGDRLAARFPLRPGEATWKRLRSEADAARELAGHTRFPVMGLVWYYAATNPTMSRTGRRTLDRLLGEEPRT